ncbi:hypothetical protein D3C72_928780 [compost metagenome]
MRRRPARIGRGHAHEGGILFPVVTLLGEQEADLVQAVGVRLRKPPGLSGRGDVDKTVDQAADLRHWRNARGAVLQRGRRRIVGVQPARQRHEVRPVGGDIGLGRRFYRLRALVPDFDYVVLPRVNAAQVFRHRQQPCRTDAGCVRFAFQAHALAGKLLRAPAGKRRARDGRGAFQLFEMIVRLMDLAQSQGRGGLGHAGLARQGQGGVALLLRIVQHHHVRRQADTPVQLHDGDLTHVGIDHAPWVIHGGVEVGGLLLNAVGKHHRLLLRPLLEPEIDAVVFQLAHQEIQAGFLELAGEIGLRLRQLRRGDAVVVGRVVVAVGFGQAGIAEQLLDQVGQVAFQVDVRPAHGTQARKPWLQHHLVVVVGFVAPLLRALGNDAVPLAQRAVRRLRGQRGGLVQQLLQGQVALRDREGDIETIRPRHCLGALPMRHDDVGGRHRLAVQHGCQRGAIEGIVVGVGHYAEASVGVIFQPPSVSASTCSALSERPSARADKTVSDSTGVRLLRRMKSILRAPLSTSVQRAAMVSATVASNVSAIRLAAASRCCSLASFSLTMPASSDAGSV